MRQILVNNCSNAPSRLRLLWDDSRCLNVYLTGTAVIAVWLKFAVMTIHWGSAAVWLR